MEKSNFKLNELALESSLGEGTLTRYIRLTTFITFALIIVFIVWAAITRIDETAIAVGEVVPEGTVRTIQHLEGGIVKEIYVKEGDIVSSGSPLISFRPEAAEAESEQQLSRHYVLLLKAERLRALATNVEPKFTDVPAKYQQISLDQQNIYTSQKVARATEIDLIRQKILELEVQKNSALGQIDITKRQEAYAVEELEMFEGLFNDQSTSRIRLLSARQKREEVRSERERLEGLTNSFKEQIKSLEGELANTTAQQQQQTFAELGAVTSELSEVKILMERFADRVSRLQVRSPVTGVVQELPVQTVGAVVQPGGLVARVVPLDEKLIISAHLSPKDVGYVRVGQSVDIKIDAYDFARFGSIAGSVKSISATTFFDDDDNPYYNIFIEMKKNYVGEDPSNRNILPGMTGQADIKTGEKTILQYLLKPIFTNIQEGFRER